MNETMLKKLIKEVVNHSLLSRIPPILVASMGRSGSTLVHSSLSRGMALARFGTARYRTESLVRDAIWNLHGAELKCGRVYKTHSLPYNLPVDGRLRVIFVFGDASDAVRSVLNCDKVYGRSWINEHFRHLEANGELGELPDRHVLRFGEQLDSWLSVDTVPVLALRYEELWDSDAATVLSHYVGFPVVFPARRRRESASISDEELEGRLHSTYSELDKRIGAMPAIFANEQAQIILNRSTSKRTV